MNKGSIICDTNIWYSAEQLARIDPKTRILATLISLLELCRTPWSLDQMDISRLACNQLVRYNKGICVYNPIRHIAIKAGLGVDDLNKEQVHDCMSFIAAIADGDEIDPNRREAFKDMIYCEREKLVIIADQLNKLVDRVRLDGVDKRDPNRGQDISLAKAFITSHIALSVKSEVVSEQINWDEAELFLKTLHWLFLDFEVSRRRWQPNDIYDLYNLAYVGKSDRYWTLDRRWVRVIESANMGHYLYDPADD